MEGKNTFPRGSFDNTLQLIRLLKRFSNIEENIKSKKVKMADIRECYYYKRDS